MQRIMLTLTTLLMMIGIGLAQNEELKNYTQLNQQEYEEINKHIRALDKKATKLRPVALMELINLISKELNSEDHQLTSVANLINKTLSEQGWVHNAHRAFKNDGEEGKSLQIQIKMLADDFAAEDDSLNFVIKFIRGKGEKGLAELENPVTLKAITFSYPDDDFFLPLADSKILELMGISVDDKEAQKHLTNIMRIYSGSDADETRLPSNDNSEGLDQSGADGENGEEGSEGKTGKSGDKGIGGQNGQLYIGQPAKKSIKPGSEL